MERKSWRAERSRGFNHATMRCVPSDLTVNLLFPWGLRGISSDGDVPNAVVGVLPGGERLRVHPPARGTPGHVRRAAVEGTSSPSRRPCNGSAGELEVRGLVATAATLSPACRRPRGRDPGLCRGVWSLGSRGRSVRRPAEEDRVTGSWGWPAAARGGLGSVPRLSPPSRRASRPRTRNRRIRTVRGRARARVLAEDQGQGHPSPAGRRARDRVPLSRPVVV